MEVLLVAFIILFAVCVVIILILYGNSYWTSRSAAKGKRGATIFKLTMNDIVKIANIGYVEELEGLVKESGIEMKMPVFYKQYQQWVKKNRESFHENLLKVLREEKEGWVEDICGEYGDMSASEMLLLILMQIDLDNKNIARILFVNPDTLKKRKTRLKNKIFQSGGQEGESSK